MVRTGWSSPEMWSARAARLRLRRAIEQSAVSRAHVMQSRFSLQFESLERRRRQLVRTAQQMSEHASQQDRQALTQQILRYYQDAGELERAVAASVGA